MNRYIALFLVLAILCGGLFGCAEASEPPIETEAPDTTPAAETTAEPEKPEELAVKMYYDDRKTPETLFGAAVTDLTVKSQTVTSRGVGTESPDTAVVTYDTDNGLLVATGTGTALVEADGVEYRIEISPAPITLLLITGHSLGEGYKGSFAESVYCEPGQAYSTTLLYDNFERLKEFENPSATVGLGAYAETNPKGIDGFYTRGRPGVGGGLALQWNRLTGEKIWVVNAAVSGSCITEWDRDAKHHKTAMKMFNYAAGVLKNEVAAGHFVLRDVATLNFSGGNFVEKKVPYDDLRVFDRLTEKWYESLWGGIAEGSTVDIDGDGKVDAPTVLGLIPIWETVITANVWDIAYRLDKYIFDKAHNFYMAASADYPQMFIASNIEKEWTDDGRVKASFPEIDYTVISGEAQTRPTTAKEAIFDNCHPTQLGYNAMGQDIAKNLYARLRTPNAPESVTVFDITADPRGEEVADTLTVKAGQATRLVFVTSPISSANLTIASEGDMTLTYGGVLTAKTAGQGKITFSYEGKILRTIHVNVTE